MEQRPIDELEAGVERLLAAFALVRGENLQLREQLVALEKQRDTVRARIDSLLARIDGVDLS